MMNEKIIRLKVHPKDFEEIYWKCPDIITHITLNFKYLSFDF